MANAKQCDRCGTLYVDSNSSLFCEWVITHNRGLFEDRIDLCPDCLTKFKKWWNDGKGEAQ